MAGGDLDAGRERLRGLLGRHRGLFGEVARAGADGVHQIAGVVAGAGAGERRDLAGDAGVDHLEDQAVGAGKGIDGRAAAEEVEHHLHGDFLREGGHAGARHAVVAGEDDDGGALERGRERLLHEAELQGQGFEAAEAALGLGLLVDLLLELGLQGEVERGDVGCLKTHGCLPG